MEDTNEPESIGNPEEVTLLNIGESVRTYLQSDATKLTRKDLAADQTLPLVNEDREDPLSGPHSKFVVLTNQQGHTLILAANANIRFSHHLGDSCLMILTEKDTQIITILRSVVDSRDPILKEVMVDSLQINCQPQSQIPDLQLSSLYARYSSGQSVLEMLDNPQAHILSLDALITDRVRDSSSKTDQIITRPPHERQIRLIEAMLADRSGNKCGYVNPEKTESLANLFKTAGYEVFPDNTIPEALDKAAIDKIQRYSNEINTVIGLCLPPRLTVQVQIPI